MMDRTMKACAPIAEYPGVTNAMTTARLGAGRKMTDRTPTTFLRRLYDWWNPPCPKHSGHRQREIDTELATQCSMCPYPPMMCSECFAEEEKKYAGD